MEQSRNNLEVLLSTRSVIDFFLDPKRYAVLTLFATSFSHSPSHSFCGKMTTFAEVLPIKPLSSHSYEVTLADEWCIGTGMLARPLSEHDALTSHSAQWRLQHIRLSHRSAHSYATYPFVAIATESYQPPSRVSPSHCCRTCNVHSHRCQTGSADI